MFLRKLILGVLMASTSLYASDVLKLSKESKVSAIRTEKATSRTAFRSNTTQAFQQNPLEKMIYLQMLAMQTGVNTQATQLGVSPSTATLAIPSALQRINAAKRHEEEKALRRKLPRS
jgi:hypothetical protein